MIEADHLRKTQSTFPANSQLRSRMQDDAAPHLDFYPWKEARSGRQRSREFESMGCGGSSRRKSQETDKKLQKPKPWKHAQPLTETQLRKMRDEFWDTAPYYGGHREMWDALRAAAESDITSARVIVDSAGIIVTSDDLTTCYDERGAKYELPIFVLSDPINLIEDS